MLETGLLEGLTQIVTEDIQAALANARLAQTDGVRAAIEHIRTEGRRVALSADAREGMMSMMERRAAKFVGS